MWINKARALTLLAIAWPGMMFAQTPLSAIDWLSDSVATPVAMPKDTLNSDISQNALPESVTVTLLGHTLPDAVGLLPVNITGLPHNLWGSSASSDLARRFKAERVDLFPAIQDLLYTLLLAELDAPKDASASSVLFLARVDTLLSLGALEPALALLERAGFENPEVFRRYFDVSLLIGSESKACSTLRATPELSPTFPARIFCLARGGSWDAAALTLQTGKALGFVTEEEETLLSRFLDPGLFEGEPGLAAPTRTNPLIYRMMEAIGEPIPTANLPLAFANADLNAHSGWKAQIEAAERLSRTSAIDPNRLLGIYSARSPAASGGVWDRVEAIQNFDDAISKADTDGVSATLESAWNAAAKVELEIAFAQLFADQLSRLPIQEQSQALSFRIGLLSKNYENAANSYNASSDRDRFLQQIATGQAADKPVSNPLMAAVRDGFLANGVPIRLQSLTNNNRLGEAILRAMELFTNGSRGDFDEVSDALAFFRAVGLEDTARRAALQLLLLERRG